MFLQTYSNENSLVQLFLQILASLLLKRHGINENEESQKAKNIVEIDKDKIQIEKHFESEEVLALKPENVKEQNDNASQKAANKYIFEDGKILRIFIKLVHIYLIVKYLF